MSNILGYIFFILYGYLSGSILFAKYIPLMFCNIDPTMLSDDNNPGTFNAFKYAGKKVGILVILLELLKGALPVLIAAIFLDTSNLLFSLVIIAPVIGHGFPIFNHFEGGKAIAVSFGVFIGLLPDYHPLLALIILYLLFSVIIIIQPHLLRTVITFTALSISGFFYFKNTPVIIATVLISLTVILKHMMKYTKEPVSIHLFVSKDR